MMLGSELSAVSVLLALGITLTTVKVPACARHAPATSAIHLYMTNPLVNSITEALHYWHLCAKKQAARVPKPGAPPIFRMREGISPRGRSRRPSPESARGRRHCARNGARG